MRTLKLSDEQIALIQQALGMAEKSFDRIHKTIIEETVHHRNDEATRGFGYNSADYYHHRSDAFGELNDKIQNGEVEA